MKKTTFIIFTVLIMALVAGGIYWFFYMRAPAETDPSTEPTTGRTGFWPFARNPSPQVVDTFPSVSTTTPFPDTQEVSEVELPQLRKISSTPVGGMGVISLEGFSILRFIDRGTGHVSETHNLTLENETISNTTLPKIYESYWNKNLNAFILRFTRGDTDTIANLFAELRPIASTTEAQTSTRFEVKGKYISDTIDQITVSPAGDKVATWNIEDAKGALYVSTFDEKTRTKLLDAPFTQATLEWPEINTLLLGTKASAGSSGYLYKVDIKTGVQTKLLGGIKGLSGTMSRDAQHVLFSRGGIDSVNTSLLTVKDSVVSEVIFKTLADKCTWSTLRKNEIYCAVPTEIPQGIYPDAWYKGTVSFVDQIWHLNTATGEVHLLANLLRLSDELIDATKLTLDPDENFLYFTNKRDLSLWSLDLNK
ncbi:MAG: hypothetical protein V4697_03525 [Patescibacteria group bacterium]